MGIIVGAGVCWRGPELREASHCHCAGGAAACAAQHAELFINQNIKTKR